MLAKLLKQSRSNVGDGEFWNIVQSLLSCTSRASLASVLQNEKCKMELRNIIGLLKVSKYCVFVVLIDFLRELNFKRKMRTLP